MDSSVSQKYYLPVTVELITQKYGIQMMIIRLTKIIIGNSSVDL